MDNSQTKGQPDQPYREVQVFPNSLCSSEGVSVEVTDSRMMYIHVHTLSESCSNYACRQP